MPVAIKINQLQGNHFDGTSAYETFTNVLRVKNRIMYICIQSNFEMLFAYWKPRVLFLSYYHALSEQTY